MNVLVRPLLIIPFLFCSIACQEAINDSTVNEEAPLTGFTTSFESKADLSRMTNFVVSSMEEGETRTLEDQLRELYTQTTSDQGLITPLDEIDCVLCSRETGFIPPPTLSTDYIHYLEDKNSSLLSTSWSAHEGLVYELTTYRLAEEEGNLISIVSTTQDQASLTLENNAAYLIYVIAIDQFDKLPPTASLPILLNCEQGMQCVELNENRAP